MPNSRRIAAIALLFLPNPHRPASTEFKTDYAALWVMNDFPPCNPYSKDETLLATRYSIALTMTDVQTSYIP